MIDIISKELLSEVLGVGIKSISFTTKISEIHIIEKGKVFQERHNIYELAHKCKEWAFNNGMAELTLHPILNKDSFSITCRLENGKMLQHLNISSKDIIDYEFKTFQWIYDEVQK